MYVLFTVYVAFIGGVATYIDHTHDRSMHACFSITVYCPTGCVMARLVPIMLLKLPIMLWSNAPEFFLLCSNYAPYVSQ